MSCEITFKNNIPVGKKHPKLMRDLLVDTKGDINEAIALYGVSLDEDFKLLGIENPTVENIYGYLDQKKKREASFDLTDEEKSFLLDLSLNNTVDDNIIPKLLNGLTIDGKFGFTPNSLRETGLFSEAEIAFAMDKFDILESLYYKLQDSNMEITPIESEYIFYNSDMSKKNPDIVETDLIEAYAGVNSVSEVLKIADEKNHHFIDSEKVAKEIYEKYKDMRPYVFYESNSKGELTRVRTNDKFTEFSKTIDFNKDYSEFLNYLEYIKDEDITLDVLQEMRDFGLKHGIILDNFDNVKAENASDIVDTLYNFIYDLQTKSDNVYNSLKEFSDIYEHYQNITPNYSKIYDLAQRSKGVYMNVESNLTDMQLFNRYGLVRIKDNIFQKTDAVINELSDYEIYELLLENSELLPKDTLKYPVKDIYKEKNIESIREKISELSKEYMSDDVLIDDVNRFVSYKILTNSLDAKPRLKEYNGDIDLDTDSFIHRFWRAIANNELLRPIFYIGKKGIESAKKLGEYTIRLLKNLLPESIFNDLVKYAKITGTESLEALTQEESDFKKDRNYYANNISRMEQFKGDYVKDSNFLYTEDSPKDFIRLGMELYEKLEPGVYGKVNYNKTGISYKLDAPSRDGIMKMEKIKNKTSKITEIKNIKNNNNQVKFC